VQQCQQRRTGNGDDGKAQHQTGDHAIGPQGLDNEGLVLTGSVLARALCAGEEITGRTGRMHGEMPVINHRASR